jgi:hypothetical protein
VFDLRSPEKVGKRWGRPGRQICLRGFVLPWRGHAAGWLVSGQAPSSWRSPNSGWAGRGWYFQRDKDLFEQAKESFAAPTPRPAPTPIERMLDALVGSLARGEADLNDGNLWAPRRALTQPALKSLASIAKSPAGIAKAPQVAKQRALAKKLREDELVLGYDALRRSNHECLAERVFPRFYEGKVGIVSKPPSSIAAPPSPRQLDELDRWRKAKVSGPGMFGDGDVLPVLVDDPEAEAVNFSPERFGRQFDLLACELPPASPSAPSVRYARLSAGAASVREAEVAAYDTAVRTGNGVRPGEIVRLGESVWTGLEPQRVPDETENPGVDVPVPVLTCTPLTTPRMPGLAPSWGSGPPWTIQVAVWMSKAELTREADKLIKLNPEPPEPIAINPEPQAQAQPEDEWAAAIRNFACSQDRLHVDQVGRQIVKKFGGQIGKKEQLRIGAIFTGMGWARCRDKSGRGFQKPRPSPVLPMNPRDSLNFDDLPAYSRTSRSSPAPGSPFFDLTNNRPLPELARRFWP